MKILVVEDERGMAQILKRGLEEERFIVSLAMDGPSAIDVAQREEFDMILLDVMLPGTNGLEVARRIRANRPRIPILMLTARDGVADVVKGLEVGADDYVTKPFSFAVLLARIRALARRVIEFPQLILKVDNLLLDIEQRRAFRGDREIRLTPKEFRLLEFLVRRKNRVATRQAILEFVWGRGESVEENTLDAFIRLLRKKVDDGEPVKLIRTVRGLGYCVEPGAE